MLYKAFFFTLASFFINASQAAIVNYSLSSIGGSAYIVDFSVENNSLGLPIEELTIFFKVGEYENISILDSPIDWDPLAIQPDTGIPDDGFADWLALGNGIGVDGSLSGFSVQFDYLLSDGSTPGNWNFDIVDPITFVVLESGAASQTVIPLPGTALLFFSSLIGVSGFRLSEKIW